MSKCVSGIVTTGLLNVQSISNKSAVITRSILIHRLDIFCTVETWHDGPDSPSLIACTPPNYKYLEKSRLRDAKTSVQMSSNHGGICVFYRCQFHVKLISLPVYKTMEVLALSVHGSVFTTALITVYRPGSHSVCSTFLMNFLMSLNDVRLSVSALLSVLLLLLLLLVSLVSVNVS